MSVRRGGAQIVGLFVSSFVWGGISSSIASTFSEDTYLAWGASNLFHRLQPQRQLEIGSEVFEAIDSVFVAPMASDGTPLHPEVIENTKLELFASLIQVFPREWFSADEAQSEIERWKRPRRILGKLISNQASFWLYDGLHYDFQEVLNATPDRLRKFVVTSKIQDLGLPLRDWSGSPVVELRHAVAQHVFKNDIGGFIHEATEEYAEYAKQIYAAEHQLDGASTFEKSVIYGVPALQLAVDLAGCFVGVSRRGRALQGAPETHEASLQRVPLIEDGYRYLENGQWKEMAKPDNRFPLNHETFAPESRLGIVKINGDFYAYPEGNTKLRRTLEATGEHEMRVSRTMWAIGEESRHYDLATISAGKGNAEILQAISTNKNWQDMSDSERAGIQKHRDGTLHHQSTFPEDAVRLSLSKAELKGLALQKQADRLDAFQDPTRLNRRPVLFDEALEETRKLATSPYEKVATTLLEILYRRISSRVPRAMYLEWKSGRMSPEITMTLEDGDGARAISLWWKENLLAPGSLPKQAASK